MGILPPMNLSRTILLAAIVAFNFSIDAARPEISGEHPRLLGERAKLQAMAKARPQEFERMLAVARNESAEMHARGLSLALGAAILQDAEMGRTAQAMAMKLVNGPIRVGHVTFGYDLALSGLIYDLCHEWWPDGDRQKFFDYVNKTVEANEGSETHVFHNGWYAYKNWGVGIAALATYHENLKAPKIFEALDRDYRSRAAPALELAGAGGGFAEGYYIHYWLYEWLFFCEVARRSAGIDYYEAAPSFYRNRALAAAFETYPGLSEHNSRRPIPMGDGGGRVFGGDRDKNLAARRILANRYRDDALHQAIHAFNETTPRVASGSNAYKDFLWRDTSVTKGRIDSLPLSHFSPGPGFVYARSSWEEDATHFFFKAGDRFTAHQHLDNGHFLIYRGSELAGDGGHYEEFGSVHDVNYHLRTIAHSTLLVHDPAEKWPAIRAGKVTGNDGGQHHAWPHHNGAVGDPQEWERDRALYDIADITSFRDGGSWMHVAADLTRSYSMNKLSKFVRQIVFLRPATFVVFDQVSATRADFKKTWLLQAMSEPAREDGHLVVANGAGKLFVRTLLPESSKAAFFSGQDLYRHGGQSYPPSRSTGPAPKCRVEISPEAAARDDLFLHVLTASDAATSAVRTARLQRSGRAISVDLGDARISFSAEESGGHIEMDGRREDLQNR